MMRNFNEKILLLDFNAVIEALGKNNRNEHTFTNALLFTFTLLSLIFNTSHYTCSKAVDVSS